MVLGSETNIFLEREEPALEGVQEVDGHLKDVWHGLRADFSEKTIHDIPITAARAAHLSIAGGIGALRLPTAFSVPLAIEIVDMANHTPLGSSGLAPVAAGLATSGANYVWGLFDASAFNGLIDTMPNAFKAVSTLPKVKHLSEILPGDTSESHLKRAIKIQSGPGIAGYMLSAGAKGLGKEQRKELRNKVGLDSALFMGALATSATLAFEIVGKNNGPAKEVTSLFSNSLFWLGVAFVGLPVSKQIAKRVIRPAVRAAKSALTETKQPALKDIMPLQLEMIAASDSNETL